MAQTRGIYDSMEIIETEEKLPGIDLAFVAAGCCGAGGRARANSNFEIDDEDEEMALDM